MKRGHKLKFFKEHLVVFDLANSLTILTILSVKPTKCSNTLKQFVDKLPTSCLSVFHHFVVLTLTTSTHLETMPSTLFHFPSVWGFAHTTHFCGTISKRCLAAAGTFLLVCNVTIGSYHGFSSFNREIMINLYIFLNIFLTFVT